MSDDDLVSVLEQVHQGRFQLPAAPLSLTTPQPSSDTRPGAVAPSTSGSMSSTSDSSIASSLADRQNATGSNSTVQGEQQSDKQAQPAATSPSGNQGADQQDTAAAKLLPDARQQQTFSLQAFTKPLMQRLQGDAYLVLHRPHLRFCAILRILTAVLLPSLQTSVYCTCVIRSAGGQAMISIVLTVATCLSSRVQLSFLLCSFNNSTKQLGCWVPY